MHLPQSARLLILLLIGLPAPAQIPVTAADDAYHFKYWKGTATQALYTEWWYFNFYDSAQDLQAIINYQVIDPANAAGAGAGMMTAVTYHGGNQIAEIDPLPVTSFSASYSAANVRVGSNTIAVWGADQYQTNGSSLDGRIVWTLTYDRESDPWFADAHVNVGTSAWEQMSWLLYMPRAHVTGTLTIDGQPFAVDSYGYHDHNWGEWNPKSLVWNWTQYAQPGLNFDLGDFVGNPNGKASIEIRGARTVFAANQYKLVHTKWAYDPKNKLFYPTRSRFTADNGVVSVALTMSVSSTVPLTSDIAQGVVVFEQTANYSGEVGASGVVTPFSGVGFKEYTGVSGAGN